MTGPRAPYDGGVVVRKIWSSLFALLLLSPATVVAQSRVLQVTYTPTKRAQVAIWIERADGTFLATVHLTEAVGLRGIGNRPGALQMNSGFRWPYGRREGVLPIWAHRRAAAPSAQMFPRVIFQNRTSEGFASRTSEDSTTDRYFCLSFNSSAALDVDATSCASVFNSDKGRFVTSADVDAGYHEPYDHVPLEGGSRTLSIDSYYPPRRDITSRASFDHADVTSFNTRARDVMPDIDAVTRATAPADTAQWVSFVVPNDWADGDYVVFVEVSTEADWNATYTKTARPTPTSSDWDSWAIGFGYTYRGQPSVVYRVPFTLDAAGGVHSTAAAEGYSEIEGLDGDLRPIDATITNDPIGAPGSGVDRLRVDGTGDRVRVTLEAVSACSNPPTVPAVTGLTADHVADEDHSHEWAAVAFTAVGVGAGDAIAYQVKVSPRPITNELEFVQAEDAKATSIDYQGLDLCPIAAGTGLPTCPAAGSSVAVTIGKLTFDSQYYVAVRALGPCGTTGPIVSAHFSTTPIKFTTVAPCFVATAAFGSPMAADVSTLRAFRDAFLMPNAPGRAFVRAYYAVGPTLAGVVRGSDAGRALARAVLRPFVQAARLVVAAGSE